MNTTKEFESLFWRLAPPVAAVLLVAVFVLLGLWQLDRAAQKTAAQALFSADADYIPLSGHLPMRDFQRLSADGHFIGGRQFLIDNMISNGRVGYFVLTPFEYATDKPLLMVNRGWVAATGDRAIFPEIPPVDNQTPIRGRMGHLPRVGIRPGDALSDSGGWPKVANYPDLSELSNALGRELLPFVLLLDPEDNSTLVRDWQPKERGPMMHYGYAFQWFAMAAAVLGILIWQTTKRWRNAGR